MDINSAFKLFDIRGQYPSQVNERLAFLVGKYAAKIKNAKCALVASDTRESSPSLKNYVIGGLSTSCKEIYDLFEVPVTQFNFTMATGSYDLGIMITASHTSEFENGFKLANIGGLPFDQSEIQALKDEIVESINDPITILKQNAQRINNSGQYINAIIKLAKITKINLRLVIDVTRSSVVTPVLIILSRLGTNFSLVKSNHTGNPLLAENRVDLENAVRQTGADLGLIWDSDGDRVVIVDRLGNLIPTSFVLGILAREALRETQGKKIVIDVRAGLVVSDLVKSVGGQIEVLPAWGQYIKFAMKNDPQIVFGGETSGHNVFADFYCIDDGILSALRFLKIWQNTNLEEEIKSLSKRYFEIPERNFPCQFDHSSFVLENLANYYRNKDYLVSIEDGLTVFGSNFKFNLRQSVTEPFLRLNLEASDEKTTDQITNNVVQLIDRQHES